MRVYNIVVRKPEQRDLLNKIWRGEKYEPLRIVSVEAGFISTTDDLPLTAYFNPHRGFGWDKGVTDKNSAIAGTITFEDFVDAEPELVGKYSDEPQPTNKYHRQLKGVTVDVYDVLKAFNVTCPATQHALKKILCADHKDTQTDLDEAIASLHRAKELAND